MTTELVTISKICGVCRDVEVERDVSKVVTTLEGVDNVGFVVLVGRCVTCTSDVVSDVSFDVVICASELVIGCNVAVGGVTTVTSTAPCKNDSVVT